MKNVSKRLLSLLLAICLLASIALPAGVMPAMAETEVDPSTTRVTEYYYYKSLTSSNPVVLNSSSYTVEAGAEVTLSFDYYIPYAPTALYVYDHSAASHRNDMKGEDGSEAYLDQTKSGINRFEITYTATGGAAAYRLHAEKFDFGGVIYIWNFSVTVNGKALAVSDSAYGNTACVVDGDMLADYAWYTGKQDPKKITVTEYTFSSDTNAANYTIFTGHNYQHSKGDTVTIEFDYYLPSAPSKLYIYNTSNNQEMKVDGKLAYFDSTVSGIGHYSFTYTVTTPGTNYRLHAATKDFGGTVYVWNTSIKVNGVEATPSNRNTGNASYITEGDKLFNYSWYPNKDTTVHKIKLSQLDLSGFTGTLMPASSNNHGLFAYNDSYGGLLKGTSSNPTMSLSFDYYLPEGMDVAVWSPQNGKIYLENQLTGSQILEPGYGSFKYETEYTSNLRWTIRFVKNTNAPNDNLTIPDLYLWNVKTVSAGASYDTPQMYINTQSSLASQINTAKGSVSATDVIDEITLADVYYDFPDTENENTSVTEIDFTGCEPLTTATNYIAYMYSGRTAPVDGDYTLSFDYYLDADSGTTNTFIGINSISSATNNTYPGAEPTVSNLSWLREGLNKYQATVTLTSGSSNYFAVLQRANKTLAKMYIWNVSLVLADGEDKTNLITGNYWDKGTASAMTPGLKLSDFTWSDASTVTPANKINLSLFDTTGLSSSAYLTQGGITTYGIFGYSDTYQLLKSSTTKTEAVLSFDYYLPEGADVVVWSSHPSSTILTNELTGSQVLEPGYGSFKVTRDYTETNSWRWFFTVVKDPDAPTPAKLPDIYVWNMNVVKTNNNTATTTTTYTTPTTTSIYSNCKLAKAGFTADQAMEVGMLSTFMDEIEAYEAKKNVAELDFSACEKTPDSSTAHKISLYTGWYGLAEAGTYTLDFDYYLPDADTHTVVMNNGVVYENEDEDAAFAPGTGWLRRGRHHFTATDVALSTGTGTSIDIVQYGDAARGTLMVWNVSLKLTGAEQTTNLASGAYWGAVATGSAVAITPTLPADLSALPIEPEDTETPDVTDPVVSQINLDKLDVSEFNDSSYLTAGTYGVFSYANAYSKLYATDEANPESTLSFDYFLPGDVGVAVYSFGTDTSDTFLKNSVTNSYVLERGQGSFSVSRDVVDTWQWGLVLVKSPSAPEANVTDIPKIYIWNLKLEYNGVTVELQTADNEFATMNAGCELATCIAGSDTPETAGLEFTTLSAIEDDITADEVNTYVTELNFSGCTPTPDTATDYVTYLYSGWTGQATAGTYTLTFDYYLPDAGTNTYVQTYSLNSSGSIGQRTQKNAYVGATPSDNFLLAGRNKFEKTGISLNPTSHTYLRFIQRGNKTMGTLYVWNVKLVRDDDTDDTNLLSGGYWNSGSTGTAVGEDNLLSDYQWYKDAVTNEPEDVSTVYHLDASGLADLSSTAAILSSSVFKATADATSEWVLSFEYYMTKEAPIWVYDGSSFYDETTDSRLLQQGRHSFSCTFTSSRTPALWYKPTTPAPATELYLWNVRLYTANGDLFKTFDPTGGSLKDSLTIEVGTPSELVGEENYANGDYVGRSTVTEIDFTGLERSTTQAVYGVATASPYYANILADTHNDNAAERINYTFELSFDYYMPAANTNTYVWLSSAYTNQFGETFIYNEAEGEETAYMLQQGRHRFEANIELKSNPGALYIRQVLDVNGAYQPSKVYIWNLSFKPVTYLGDGTEATIKDNQFMGCGWSSTNGVVKTTELVDKAYVDNTEEIDLAGTQYREDYSLRFVSTVECAEVGRVNNHEANYDSATITINGVTYKMTGAGTLFARDVKLNGTPDEMLTLDNDNVGSIIRNVPAERLLAQEHLDNLNNRNETSVSGIAFTCVIKHIPRANWDETMSARPYVTYKDEAGNEHVWYGEVVSRSVLQTQPLYTEQSSEYDDEADDMRSDIINSVNVDYNLNEFDAVIYVSSISTAETSEGTAAAPFKTIKALNDYLDTLDSSAKKLVLFERGSLFRGSVYMYANTTYSAYGEGQKPRFYGSLEDYADNTWTKDDSLGIDNVWVLNTADHDDFQCIDTEDAHWGNDIGNIFFIDETTDGEGNVTDTVVQWGEKLYYDSAYPIVDSTETKTTSTPKLLKNFQFFHDRTNHKLYLYYDGGDPTTIADRIEMGGRFCVFKRASGGADNITVENVCIKYAGGHGIGFGANDNVVVRNCEIGWIGGSMHSGPTLNEGGTAYSGGRTRYGNGIEIYGTSSNDEIYNNWIYQCFDAGYTNQGGDQSDINVHDNLIEYCCYSIELWDGTDEDEEGIKEAMTDCTYHDNILRFAGYNFERDNRMGSGLTVSAHINCFYSAKDMKNVIIENNVLDTAYCQLVAAAYPNDVDVDVLGRGPILKNNTYVQGYDYRSCVAFSWDIDNDDPLVEGSVPKTYYNVNNQAQMVRVVESIDAGENWTAIYSGKVDFPSNEEDDVTQPEVVNE